MGFDAGKKIKGRKRHILVGTLGLLLRAEVHSAGIQDRDGATLVFNRLAGLGGKWVDRVQRSRGSPNLILDIDSSKSPVRGEQEASAYNGHFGCNCYHPLFVFNQHSDLKGCSLRPGNVHSADNWRAVLDRVVKRYRWTSSVTSDPVLPLISRLILDNHIWRTLSTSQANILRP